MLFNFCDSRLRPEIQCSSVSTEGYEVTNLINDSARGFLAYACIKPPVNIDITFLCNVCINHILIWPQVGSQKSTGFQLYAKTSNDNSVPYVLLATAFLDRSNTGMLLHPSSVNPETISVPPNFVKRYTKPSLRYLVTYISSLRICICKTDNSVPALSRIEVWGTVSPRCGKDTVASIYALWSKQDASASEVTERSKRELSPPVIVSSNREEVSESSLQVPECFLDAITWEIMTQPILLPSGKIIDQSTLQKHEETEALWGRRLTDPFTGIPFSEDRKPVISSTLKVRIDKFLLENSNSEEIKKLPRVLGRASSSSAEDKKISEIPKYLLHENVISKNSNDAKTKLHYSATDTPESKKFCHKLPVVVMSHKQSTQTLIKPAKKRKTFNSYMPLHEESESEAKNNCIDMVNSDVDSNTNFDIDAEAPNLKRFNSIPKKNDVNSELHSCTCCSNGIFYQLPCKHVLCRKILTSIQDNQCTLCNKFYKNSEVKRIYE